MKRKTLAEDELRNFWGIKPLRMTNKGFTLIELLIVLFIVGVVSALVGITLYKSMDDLNLKTLSKEMSASMRYARSRAVAEKKNYSFIIDKNSYGLYSALANEESEVKAQETVAHKTFPEGTIFEGKDNSESLRIDFFPEGDSTGGEIELKNQKGSKFLITVERITGKVKVKKS